MEAPLLFTQTSNGFMLYFLRDMNRMTRVSPYTIKFRHSTQEFMGITKMNAEGIKTNWMTVVGPQ